MKTIELRLPSWMACPLINGDTSGCDENDETKLAKLETWLASEGYSSSALDVANEDEFQRPSHDACMIYGETLAGGFADYTFPRLSPSPRKGTLEAKLMAWLSPDLRASYDVIAYELTHDGQGWSVNTPFKIATDVGIAGLLEVLRGRWEVYKANYSPRATVASLADIGEGNTFELESDCIPFARVERSEA